MLIQHPGARITDEEIKAFESKFGINFPEDYRLFMLECNGGHPFPDAFRSPNGEVVVTVFELYPLYPINGFQSSLLTACNDPLMKDAVRHGYVQIAEDSGGHRILMIMKGDLAGRIIIELDSSYYYISHSFNELLRKLESREGVEADFLDGLKEKRILEKPKDQRGHVYHSNVPLLRQGGLASSAMNTPKAEGHLNSPHSRARATLGGR
jgi:hypothetical protein